MSASNNENSTKYLDKNVLLLFLGVFLISGTVLAYRFYSDFPCSEVIIDIKAREYRVGELIKFIDITEQGKKWEWDFGDNSVISIQREALHVYNKPGKYDVRLLVNNSCEKIETIIIKEKKFILDPNKIPKLIVPDSITVGEKLTLIDYTKGALTWEWRFGETANANATTKKATYSYKEPGLKTITLFVNGDVQHIAKKRIKVYAKTIQNNSLEQITPPQRELGWDVPDKPASLKKDEEKEIKKIEIPFISEPAFEKKLLKVSEEKTTEKDFADYFCGNINKPIVVNGKNTTFLVFCQRIRGKNIKIKRLTIFRNDGSNCIENMNIEYTRKLL